MTVRFALGARGGTPEVCVRVAGGYAARRRHRIAEIVQSEPALRQECVNNYK